MILLMLIIRIKGILNSILLEDVLLFIHSGIRWLSWYQGLEQRLFRFHV